LRARRAGSWAKRIFFLKELSSKMSCLRGITGTWHEPRQGALSLDLPVLMHDAGFKAYERKVGNDQAPAARKGGLGVT